MRQVFLKMSPGAQRRACGPSKPRQSWKDADEVVPDEVAAAGVGGDTADVDLAVDTVADSIVESHRGATARAAEAGILAESAEAEPERMRYCHLLASDRATRRTN